MPTLAALTGCTQHLPSRTDGMDISPLFRGKQVDTDHRLLYWEFPGKQRAARRGDWKCVTIKRNAPLELYNLKDDPTESHDLANAIATNDIDALAKNRANAGDFDTHFSVETPKQSITDQQSSGRCWMFSGLNVLRSNFAQRTDSLRTDFSQAYLFFYDQLEKANLFLQGVLDTAKKPIDDERVQFFFKSPINDGGTFCGVADLADKYGLAPKSAMPESYSTDNTSRMSRLISSKLREQGLKLRQMVADGKKAADIEKAKTEMLSTIYHMLTLTIGEPPRQFAYAFKNEGGEAMGEARTWTPMEFYKEVVGDQKLNGSFIMVMNDPRRPYHKTYEVEYDRHTYDGHNWKYLNLPMDDIEQMAIASLKDGRKMYSSYDVGKQLDRKRGEMSMPSVREGKCWVQPVSAASVGIT